MQVVLHLEERLTRMITVMEIIKRSSIFEVHRSRSRGGVLNVSLTELWALMDADLPGVAVSPSQKDPPPDRCG
jgi:hypothetical protein